MQQTPTHKSARLSECNPWFCTQRRALFYGENLAWGRWDIDSLIFHGRNDMLVKQCLLICYEKLIYDLLDILDSLCSWIRVWHVSECNLVHSEGPYGENLAWGSGDLSGEEAVKMWVDEKTYYDYNSNSCAPGRVCGHYTQVVWRESVRLGCAKVTCTNGGTFIGCNYDPPGNYIGKRPY
ncbi:pathogenesis-related protein 1 [Jatropha curcas]|uniref:pathogenesis-related protein 1 n=1 Tax=Jatropha curcas TaxID=180498 RepID=UPI0018947FA5|nr:pathogenesis-related protein 1 [Jatropha curcas]